jgi:hypothetical protein
MWAPVLIARDIAYSQDVGASCFALPVALKHVSDKADLIFPHPKHDIRDYSVTQTGNYKLTYNYTYMEHNYMQQLMQDSLRYMTSLGSQHKSLYKVNIHFT